MKLPIQFADDVSAAVLESYTYYDASAKRLDPSSSRWVLDGPAGRYPLFRAAWESGWDAAIAEVKRRAMLGVGP